MFILCTTFDHRGHFARLINTQVEQDTGSRLLGMTMIRPKTKSPKTNCCSPWGQTVWWRSGQTVSHWSLWIPEFARPSPAGPLAVWPPRTPVGLASCWRAPFPAAPAACRWTPGSRSHRETRRRSREHSWRTSPAWTPWQNLQRRNS